MIAEFLKSSDILQLVVQDTQKIDTAKWCPEQYLPKVIENLKNLQPNSMMEP